MALPPHKRRLQGQSELIVEGRWLRQPEAYCPELKTKCLKSDIPATKLRVRTEGSIVLPHSLTDRNGEDDGGKLHRTVIEPKTAVPSLMQVCRNPRIVGFEDVVPERDTDMCEERC